jgi:hypothetical protein
VNEGTPIRDAFDDRMVLPNRVVLLSLLQRAGAPTSRLVHAAAQYQTLRLHPELFDPDRVRTEWLHPDLVRWLSSIEAGGEVCETASLVRQEAREIYSFPLLNERACHALMEEVRLDGITDTRHVTHAQRHIHHLPPPYIYPSLFC